MRRVRRFVLPKTDAENCSITTSRFPRRFHSHRRGGGWPIFVEARRRPQETRNNVLLLSRYIIGNNENGIKPGKQRNHDAPI